MGLILRAQVKSGDGRVREGTEEKAQWARSFTRPEFKSLALIKILGMNTCLSLWCYEAEANLSQELAGQSV